MNSDISEIKSRLNIVDVLGEYIRLEKAGVNWRALCPFHNEKSPSFMINEEKQIWHCFGCQKGGDVLSFVMEMEGIEFRDALKLLAEKAGVQLQNFNPKKAGEKNRAKEILELSTKWYEYQLWNGPGKVRILKYLRDRGLRDETIKEFRLGYAPNGWRNILSFLLSRGFRTDEIAKTGLLVERQATNDKRQENFYDRFRDRIMFPIADYSGNILGYSARVAPGGDESQAKYVNTPETENYHKSRVLYGLNLAKSEIKKKDQVILVEGNMDVIASHQAGLKNTIAVSGTALTSEQIDIIKRYTKNIKMFFDMDSAGEAATKKSIKLCFSKDVSANIVSLAGGKDAADLAKDNPKELVSSVEKSLSVMDYLFEKALKKFDKNEVEGKKKIAQEILEVVFSFENDVEKNHWIKKLAEVLDTPESALTDMLKKVSLRSRIEKSENPFSEKIEPKAKSKIEILEREFAGLMLIFPAVWKKAVQKSEKESVSFKNELLQKMLSDGEKSEFSFDLFLKNIAENINLTKEAEKVFFEKKYQLDLNNNLEEIDYKDPISDFDLCFLEIKKELRKKEMAQIISDLKLAEKRKDRQAVIFLSQELDKISKNIS